jgi:hypothetical protein
MGNPKSAPWRGFDPKASKTLINCRAVVSLHPNSRSSNHGSHSHRPAFVLASFSRRPISMMSLTTRLPSARLDPLFVAHAV